VGAAGIEPTTSCLYVRCERPRRTSADDCGRSEPPSGHRRSGPDVCDRAKNARWTEWTGEQQLWPAPLPHEAASGTYARRSGATVGSGCCKDCGRASSILDRALSVQPLSRPAEAKVGLGLASSASITFAPTKSSTGATTERVSSGPGFPRGHVRFSRHLRRLCAGGAGTTSVMGISGAGTASSARGPRGWPWAARRRSRGPRS